MLEFVYILSYISLILSIPGLVYTVFVFKRLPKFQGAFFFLFLEQTIVSSTSYFLSMNEISNHWLLNIDSFMILLIALSFFYSQFRFLVLSVEIIYLIFFLWFVCNYSFSEYSYLLYFISSVIVISFNLFQLFQLISFKSVDQKITRNPVLFINCGFLFYFSITIMTTLFDAYFLNQGINGYTLVVILQFVAAVLLNMFLLIGVWKTSKK